MPDASRPSVSFDFWSVAWDGYAAFVEDLVATSGARRICEVGAGARPSLPLEFVESRALDYVILDVSKDELAKAPRGYSKIQADIRSPKLELDGLYDLVLSRMVAEHIDEPETFHANVHNVLAPGGRAFHFFPTLYALPFVVNRILPSVMSLAVLKLLRPQRARNRAKFRVYYAWCRGPTAKQVARFETLGYIVEAYIGFFGHNYYAKVKPLQSVADASARVLVRHPVSLLTSFAYVILRKPPALVTG